MEPGREELSGIQEEAEGLEPEIDGGDDGESNDSDSYESPIETVKREFERLQREGEEDGDGQESPEAEAQSPEAQKVVKKGKKGKAQAEQVEAPAPFQIPPPNRLTLEQKEIFHQLPDQLKRAVHGMFKAHDGAMTQTMQKLTSREREASAVIEAVNPYLYAHPELSEAGYTPSRLVGALVAAHQRLTDPKTARHAIAELCQQAGVEDHIVQAVLEGAPRQMQQPQVSPLPDEAKEAIEWIRSEKARQENAVKEKVTAELYAVQNEQGPDGRYLRPFLHDPAFLEQWKPLVSALARTLPYGEAGKEAYAILTRTQNGNSAQVNQTRLPAQNSQQMQRAQQAAVSVRGKSSPSTTYSSNWADEVPLEDLGDVRQTVRLALENMRRGVS